MSEELKKKPELVSTETFENKTNQQLLDEIAQLDIETKAQDLQLKKLDLVLKTDQVAKLTAQINQKRDDARSRDIAIKNYLKQRELQQDNCNHRKGGTGAEAFLTGQGDSSYYSVIKHRLPCNQYFVLCQRCGKEWHPGNVKLGMIETPGYQEAIRFNTNNTASGSSSFLFETTGA